MRGAARRIPDIKRHGRRFLLTRLMRGAANSAEPGELPVDISTHAPHARRGLISFVWPSRCRISTHAPHARRGGVTGFTISALPFNFYSRASCEARQRYEEMAIAMQDFYSRASCEARPYYFFVPNRLVWISTHAPHARRGRIKRRNESYLIDFYSRASCEARQLPLSLDIMDG